MKKKGLGWIVFPLLVLLSVAHAQPGKVTYVYTDPQGTPLAEADANGNVTATFDYKPYGSQAFGLPVNGPGYTGHVKDQDTGLVYMQARYYDPVVGRFLSVDPLSPSAGDINSFSRYLYVKGNPVRNVDPDGRQSYPGNLDYPGAPVSNAQATAVTGAVVLQGIADGFNWVDVNVQTPLAGSGIEEQFTPALSGGLHGGTEVFSAAAVLVRTSVKAEELRRIGTGVFKDSKLFKMAVNGGRCEYCGAAAEVGDHAKSLKSFAGEVNAGHMTKAEAVEMAHSPDNIKSACSICNGEKGGKNLSQQPDDGGYVPKKDRED